MTLFCNIYRTTLVDSCFRPTALIMTSYRLLSNYSSMVCIYLYVCVECGCEVSGTVGWSQLCHVTSGHCQCRALVNSRRCDECVDGAYNLQQHNTFGCQRMSLSLSLSLSLCLSVSVANSPRPIWLIFEQFNVFFLFLANLYYPWELDFWPFDLESSVRVTCDVGYHCANFSLPKPLCSRLRPDVCDRQTDVRQHHRLMPAPGVGA